MKRYLLRFIGLYLLLLAQPLLAVVPSVDNFKVADSAGSDVTTLNVDDPISIVNDDLLLVLCYSDTTNESPPYWTSPSGGSFTLIVESATTNDIPYSAWWRIWDGTETQLACNQPTSSDMISYSVRITNVETTDPIDAVGTPANDASDDAVQTIAQITTTVNDCRAFYIGAFDGGDGLSVAESNTGWAENDEHTGNVAAGDGVAATWGSKSMASAGATGSVTLTYSTSDGKNAVQFAICDIAGSGGNTSLRRRRTN